MQNITKHCAAHRIASHLALPISLNLYNFIHLFFFINVIFFSLFRINFLTFLLLPTKTIIWNYILHSSQLNIITKALCDSIYFRFNWFFGCICPMMYSESMMVPTKKNIGYTVWKLFKIVSQSNWFWWHRADNREIFNVRISNGRIGKKTLIVKYKYKQFQNSLKLSQRTISIELLKKW